MKAHTVHASDIGAQLRKSVRNGSDLIARKQDFQILAAKGPEVLQQRLVLGTSSPDHIIRAARPNSSRRTRVANGRSDLLAVPRFVQLAQLFDIRMTRLALAYATPSIERTLWALDKGKEQMTGPLRELNDCGLP